MSDDDAEGERSSLYARVGGSSTFRALVDRFYDGVERDPLLRPIYPEPELTGARERLCAFLVQYFGGPHDYEAMRGNPRLRMRHLVFPIDAAAAEAWLTHMRDALAHCVADETSRSVMLDYFEQTAAFLVNNEGLSLGTRRFSRRR